MPMEQIASPGNERVPVPPEARASAATGAAPRAAAAASAGPTAPNANAATNSGPFNHAPPEGHARRLSEVLGENSGIGVSDSPDVEPAGNAGIPRPAAGSRNESRRAPTKDPPALLQQFRLFYAKDRPIGVVLWATVNDEVAERLAAGTTRLRPQDWKSGDKLWVVEVIAPFGGAEEMIKDLKEKVFPNRPIHFVAVTKDGKKDVRVV